MATVRRRLAVLCFLVLAFLLGSIGFVSAQEDQIRFIVTPQVWLTTVSRNGFSSPSSAGGLPQAVGSALTDDLDVDGPHPTSSLFPQWGGQIAAQYQRWTLGISAQYASFETRTNLLNGSNVKVISLQNDANGTSHIRPDIFDFAFPCGPAGGPAALPCGTKVATESVQTDRIDIDLTASHFFPDVITGLLDLSAGAGVKWIRASGQRTLLDTLSVPTNEQRTGAQPNFGANYLLKNGHVQNKASFLDNIYGVTFSVTANFHLTSSGKWLLPLTATPLIGYETSADQVVGFDSKFVKGGTLDAGIRYVFDNGNAIYVGYRGQAIDGVNLYVAHGPLLNLSIPFGGK